MSCRYIFADFFFPISMDSHFSHPHDCSRQVDVTTNFSSLHNHNDGHAATQFIFRGTTPAQPMVAPQGGTGMFGRTGAAAPGAYGAPGAVGPGAVGPGTAGAGGNGINIFLVPTRGVGSCSSDTSSGMVQLPSMFSMSANMVAATELYNKTSLRSIKSFL